MHIVWLTFLSKILSIFGRCTRRKGRVCFVTSFWRRATYNERCGEMVMKGEGCNGLKCVTSSICTCTKAVTYYTHKISSRLGCTDSCWYIETHRL